MARTGWMMGRKATGWMDTGTGRTQTWQVPQVPQVPQSQTYQNPYHQLATRIMGSGTAAPATTANWPASPAVNLPQPFPQNVTSDATRMARARAAQAAYLPYQMEQFQVPGVSYSAGTAALAVPQAVGIRAGAENEIAQMMLQARQANEMQRQAGQGLGFDRALAQAQAEAAQAEMVRQFTRQNQGLLLDALMRGGGGWGMF